MITSILSLLTLIMPTLLNVIGMWIKKKVEEEKLSAEVWTTYQSFVASIANDSTSSAKLRASAKAQLESFK